MSRTPPPPPRWTDEPDLPPVTWDNQPFGEMTFTIDGQGIVDERLRLEAKQRKLDRALKVAYATMAFALVGFALAAVAVADANGW